MFEKELASVCMCVNVYKCGFVCVLCLRHYGLSKSVLLALFCLKYFVPFIHTIPSRESTNYHVAISYIVWCAPPSTITGDGSFAHQQHFGW